MATEVTRTIEEQLSAFLDGELPNEELQLLVRRLERDEDYRATLARYSMIGSILRDDPVDVSSMKFRSKVMAQIEGVNDSGSKLARETASGRQWLKPFASVAAIAVAVTALVNSGVFDSGPGVASNRQAVQPAQVTRAKPAASSSVLASGGNGAAQRLRSAELERERLRSYMVSHGEYARSFQGPIGNSRIFVKQVNFEE